MTKLTATLRKIYAFRALDDFILIYPFYSIYMAAHGLSVFQISTLFILWSVVDLLTNVPTGVLADKYSRKNLLGIGQLCKAAGFLVWFLYPQYTGFAVGFVLWGIGGALTDGTFEALVYDELKASRRQGVKASRRQAEYVKVVGRANSLSLVAELAATLVAGAAILLGYDVLFIASVVVVITSSLLVFTLPETPRFEELADTRYFSMLRAGLNEAIHNRTILANILLLSFIGAIYGSIEEYDSLFIHDTGVSLTVVAWVLGIVIAAAAIGSFIAYRFEKLTTSKFMLLLLLSGVFLLLAGRADKVAAVALLTCYTFSIRLLQAVYDGKLQHEISSGLRATVSSVSGFSLEIMSIVAYISYGLLADKIHNRGAYSVFGGTVVIVAALYLLTAPRLLARRSLKQMAEL